MGGSVPLSEHEQRQLEQIEQALYADYPRFANAVRASDPRVHYKRRVVEAAFGFVLGIGMLLGGVVSKYIWIAVTGFVVMLACAMWALNSYRHMTGTAVGRGQPRAPGASRKNTKAAKVPMMERLEERWRRRQERERGGQ